MNKALFLQGELVFGSQNLSDENRAALKAELLNDNIETVEDDFDDSVLPHLDSAKAAISTTFVPKSDDPETFEKINCN